MNISIKIERVFYLKLDDSSLTKISWHPFDQPSDFNPDNNQYLTKTIRKLNSKSVLSWGCSVQDFVALWNFLEIQKRWKAKMLFVTKIFRKTMENWCITKRNYHTISIRIKLYCTLLQDPRYNFVCIMYTSCKVCGIYEQN